MMRIASLIGALLLLATPVAAQVGTQSTNPTPNPVIGIVPVVSGSAVATMVAKAAPGNLYSVYATNASATAGNILVLNLTAAPADGAVTPLDCIPIAGNSTSGLSYAPGPPKVFTVGITIVLSSAASCYTKTTGVITGFISASAP